MLPLFLCFSPSSSSSCHPFAMASAFPLSVVLFVLLSTIIQFHPSVSAPVVPSSQGGANEGGGQILLSRYGRAAVLSRYGKRGEGGAIEHRQFERGVGTGPWFLCKLSMDGQFLRCRSPLQRRKK
ncbi:hypothetical protein niasHS_007102 [Heterodera schachtii]|uniref:Secreted protein n=1 Tax=Heterodera schachtii TaxID=97005 RepID=A0ABD2JL13_HETSC